MGFLVRAVWFVKTFGFEVFVLRVFYFRGEVGFVASIFLVGLSRLVGLWRCFGFWCF